MTLGHMSRFAESRPGFFGAVEPGVAHDAVCGRECAGEHGGLAAEGDGWEDSDGFVGAEAAPGDAVQVRVFVVQRAVEDIGVYAVYVDEDEFFAVQVILPPLSY